MDEVLDCGCRMEERGIPYAKEFVAEPDCPIHGRLDGVSLIAAERARQVSEEDWTPEHDDLHADGSIAMAAATYATPAEHRRPPRRGVPNQPETWPWEEGSFKPTPGDRTRELVKAGALIAAEIDRIQRRAR